jgi:hypothetical protein
MDQNWWHKNKKTIRIVHVNRSTVLRYVESLLCDTGSDRDQSTIQKKVVADRTKGKHPPAVTRKYGTSITPYGHND